MPVDQPNTALLSALDEGTGQPQGFLNAGARGGVGSNNKASLTVTEAAERLAPDPGWSGAFGAGATVTYGFRSSAPADIPGDATDFSRFHEPQILQAELALAAWSDVANITFVRVGAGSSGAAAFTDTATLLFGNFFSGGGSSTGFAVLPGSPADPAAASAQGDIWLRTTSGTNLNPAMGNDGRLTLVHEIGHAIGLVHPGDYDSVGGGSFTYAVDAEYYEDTRQYTVMSYFTSSNTGGNFGASSPATPMLDDIAAAQRLYGPNTATRAGDTVYGFNSTADREWFAATTSSTRLVFAVWDAGGADTFDFSGYAHNATISLEAGAFSSVGGLAGNVAIAVGVTIENLVSGDGSDAITGNNVANRIWGGAGHDQINAHGGLDFVRGGTGNDRIFGGGGFDDLHGNEGNDTLYGGSDDDWVVGGKDNDWLFGDGGMDIVYGNLGDDSLDGGADADVVRGGQGDDTCVGGAGDDFISGDFGTDVLTGGAGADRFHIFLGSGSDRVTDFVAGVDKVQLLAGQTWTVEQVGANAVVYVGALGSPDHLVLVNVKLSALTAGWII
jgi:serralysin